MLLDAHSLIYRAYFALLETPLTTSKGQLVNAAFGFWSIVLRGFADMQPDHVMCCFDVGRSFRADRFEAYKATRRPTPDDLRDQFPIVRETLAAFGIPIYEMAGFEADDLIGSLSRQAELQDLETIIVSGDLDMLQLVSERTKLMTTRMGVQSTVIYDPARIYERYGLDPGQMIDFKALKGDSTDNIPGVPGVGDKTAARLLVEFGSLEGVYARLHDVQPDKLREKLKEHREDRLLWRELVTIDRLAPIELQLEGTRLGHYDRAEVIRLFREYEFRTLVERLPAMTGETAGDAAEALRSVASDGSVPAARVAGAARPAGWGSARPVAPPSEGGGLQLSLDFDAVARPARSRGSRGRCRGRGRRPAGPPRRRGRPGRPAYRAGRGDRRPEPDRGPRGGGDRPPWSRGWPPSRPSVSGCCWTTTRPRRGAPVALALAGADGRTIAVEGPADAAALASRTAGHPRRRPRGQAAARGPDRRRPRRTRHPGRVRHPDRRVHPQCVAAEPVHLGCRRGAARPDPAAGRGAGQPGPRRSRGALRDRRPRAAGATPPRRGPRPPVRGDRAAADRRPRADGGDRRRTGPRRARIASHGVRCRDLRLEAKIYADVGHEFNLGSPKQLEQILFYELNLPKGKRTKTGYSTDASVLEDLRPAHRPDRQAARVADLHEAALDLRRDVAGADRADGRIHTTFHQAGAATGRLSSSDPNLQNIPVRTELRAAHPPGLRPRRAGACRS